MMIKRAFLNVAMGLALATAASTSYAEGASGFYFGVSGGQSEADLSQDELDAYVLDLFALADVTVLSATSDLEEKDTSFSLYGGYRFSQFLAIEAGYVDFGAAEYRATGTIDINIPPVPPLPGSYSADVEVKGFTAAALGTLPLNEMFDVHAQLGVLFADTEITERVSIDTESFSQSFSANSQDFFYGIGVGMNVGQRWNISLDWQQFKDVGDDEETGESDLDRLSLGFTYKL